jgi:ABC-type lipoprotein export system ATPase subunit
MGTQVVKLLRKLVDDRQQTIIMVTHDPEVAAKADRIVKVRDGLIESDEPVMAGAGSDSLR